MRVLDYLTKEQLDESRRQIILQARAANGVHLDVLCSLLRRSDSLDINLLEAGTLAPVLDSLTVDEVERIGAELQRQIEDVAYHVGYAGASRAKVMRESGHATLGDARGEDTNDLYDAIGLVRLAVIARALALAPNAPKNLRASSV